MFDKLDMDSLAKMMSEVQSKLQDGQITQDDKLFEAKSGGGLVCVSMKGNFEIVDLSIDDTLLDDKESLEILLMSAFNEVLQNVIKDKAASMGDMFKGFMPGNFEDK